MVLSEQMFQSARRILVGGVNSPVRAFKSVGGTPVFFKEGYGSRLVSVDDHEFIDYVLSWGPMILGHAFPPVVESIVSAVHRGLSFGAPTEAETILADLIHEFFPSMERVRFVNSGTEACMSAIRLARGVTGRRRILKFEGCYHGHADALLVKAGSGGLTLGCPDSAGVLSEWAQWTSIAPYNDLESVRKLFANVGDDIAAIIVEPVVGNMGVVPPNPGFLQGLRDIASAHGTLLIFDEVMTGFRVALKGAQHKYGVVPDITCLGKVVGGGLPCAAYGGRAEFMEYLAPVGPVYQAGTLSGNPVAMAAGISTLTALKTSNHFERAESHASHIVAGMRQWITAHGLPLTVSQVGTMWTLFFSDTTVFNLATAQRSDTRRFSLYYRAMLDRGVYLAPSQFESNFTSSAHTLTDADFFISSFEKSLDLEIFGK